MKDSFTVTELHHQWLKEMAFTEIDEVWGGMNMVKPYVLVVVGKGGYYFVGIQE